MYILIAFEIVGLKYKKLDDVFCSIIMPYICNNLAQDNFYKENWVYLFWRIN